MKEHLKKTLKKSESVKGLVSDLKTLYFSRFTKRRAVVARYLSESASPRLYLGAGTASLSGWLCTDIRPSSPDIVYLDMTQPFPLPDASFEYVYSEHSIEHVPHRAGIVMLRECRRVLKTEGVLRIATPDLNVLLALRDSGQGAQREYIEWISGMTRIEPTAISVINNAFREWGHKDGFLYDEETLIRSLREAGFSRVERVGYNESRHAALRGVEQHGISVRNEPMVVFETMIFEARP